MRPTLVVVLHPSIQDLLGDLGAGQRRQGGQQLLAQGLVEPLDLAGGGRGPDPGEAVGDAVLPQDPLEQHLGRAGLAEPACELGAVEFLLIVKVAGWVEAGGGTGGTDLGWDLVARGDGRSALGGVIGLPSTSRIW